MVGPDQGTLFGLTTSARIDRLYLTRPTFPYSLVFLGLVAIFLPVPLGALSIPLSALLVPLRFLVVPLSAVHVLYRSTQWDLSGRFGAACRALYAL